MADAEPRYYLQKLSGSHWCRVMDRATGFSMARFNILKGQDKRNGWNLAEAMCKRLNEQAATKEGDTHAD